MTLISHIKHNILLVILFTLLKLQVASAQELSAVRSSVNLKTPRKDPASIYDGDDTIFIFGGYYEGKDLNEMHVYTISTDSFKSVTKTNINIRNGLLVFGANGDLYNCAGQSYVENIDRIMKYNAEASFWTLATSITPNRKYWGGIVKATENDAYIIGGYATHLILHFNMADQTSTIFDTLPEMDGKSGSSAVWVENSAIIFNSYKNAPTQIIRYTPSEKRTVVLSTTFPELLEFQAVSDGSSAYIVGGTQDSQLRGGLIKVNITTGDWSFIPVKNFPGGSGSGSVAIQATSAVYVGKLNRIYFFGWWQTTGAFSKGIWWIDLNTDVPTTTTTTQVPPTTSTPIEFDCAKKPDGMYPHPINCNMFFVCEAEVATEYSCPEPLLFDPVKLSCNLPHLVQCRPPFFDCANKADGFYPHPDNCNMFVSCEKEVATEYTCPEPLLFDPLLLTCNLPNLVNCGGGALCADKIDGTYPHPNNCSLFLICSNGEDNIFSCPGNLLFDPIEEKCNFPELVNCERKNLETNATMYTIFTIDK